MGYFEKRDEKNFWKEDSHLNVSLLAYFRLNYSRSPYLAQEVEVWEALDQAGGNNGRRETEKD